MLVALPRYVDGTSPRPSRMKKDTSFPPTQQHQYSFYYEPVSSTISSYYFQQQIPSLKYYLCSSITLFLIYYRMCTITVIPSRSLCCSVLCSFFFCVVVEFFADLVVCVVCFALSRTVPVFPYLTLPLSHYLTISLSHYLTFTLLLKHSENRFPVSILNTHKLMFLACTNVTVLPFEYST